jgi:alpha-ketoglutarate-dependent taurine dioxygenase
VKIEKIFEEWGSIFHTDDVDEAISMGAGYWKQAMYDRRVVVLRNPDATMEQYWKWCACFGKPWTATQYQRMRETYTKISVDGQPQYLGLFSNKISARLADKGMVWHADNPDLGERSLPMRALRMAQCPNPEHGLTGFLNVELAWKSLPDDVKATWRTRKVEQQSWYQIGTEFEIYPAVKVHPITGIESPRANDWCVAGTDRNNRWIHDVIGADDSRLGGQEMGDLIGMMEKVPNCIWYHKWMEGDVIIYDNHAFVHNRTPLKLEPNQERLLWRMNIDHDFEFKWKRPVPAGKKSLFRLL